MPPKNVSLAINYFKLVIFYETFDMGETLQTKLVFLFKHLKEKLAFVRVSPSSTRKKRMIISLETLISEEGNDLNVQP